MKTLKTYHLNYKKEVWGFFVIKAKNLKEAREKADNRDFDDEFDNNSDYVIENEIIEVE